MPYDNDVLETFPPIRIEGRAIWSSSTAIICRGVVEFHLPIRCLCQLGFVQIIPLPVHLHSEADHLRLHRHKPSSKVTGAYAAAYGGLVQLWHDRRDYIYRARWHFAPTIHPEYMSWFHRRTLRFISHPEHRRPGGFIGSADYARAEVRSSSS